MSTPCCMFPHVSSRQESIPNVTDMTLNKYALRHSPLSH